MNWLLVRHDKVCHNPANGRGSAETDECDLVGIVSPPMSCDANLIITAAHRQPAALPFDMASTFEQNCTYSPPGHSSVCRLIRPARLQDDSPGASGCTQRTPLLPARESVVKLTSRASTGPAPCILLLDCGRLGAASSTLDHLHLVDLHGPAATSRRKTRRLSARHARGHFEADPPSFLLAPSVRFAQRLKYSAHGKHLQQAAMSNGVKALRT